MGVRGWKPLGCLMFGWVPWRLSCFGVVAARLPPCFIVSDFCVSWVGQLLCGGWLVVGVGEVGGGRALVGSGYSDVQIFLGVVFGGV